MNSTGRRTATAPTKSPTAGRKSMSDHLFPRPGPVASAAPVPAIRKPSTPPRKPAAQTPANAPAGAQPPRNPSAPPAPRPRTEPAAFADERPTPKTANRRPRTGTNPAQSPAVGRNKTTADPNPPPEPNKTAAPHPPLARTKPGNPAPQHINQPRPSTTDIRSLLRDRPDRNPPHPNRAPRPPNNHPQNAPTTRNANPTQTTHSAPTETRRNQTAHPAPPTTTDPNPPPEPNKTATPHPPLAWTKPGNPTLRYISQPRPSPTDDTQLLLHDRPGLNPPQPSRARPRNSRPQNAQPQNAPTTRNDNPAPTNQKTTTPPGKPTDGTQGRVPPIPARKNQKTTAPPEKPANPTQATHSAPTKTSRAQTTPPAPPTTTDPNPPPEPNKTAAPHPPLARTKPENLAPRHDNQPHPSPTNNIQPLLHNPPDLNPQQSIHAPRPPNNRPQTAPTTRNANPAQATHSAATTPTETRRAQAAHPAPQTTTLKTRLAAPETDARQPRTEPNPAQSPMAGSDKIFTNLNLPPELNKTTAPHPPLAWAKPGNLILPGIPASLARPAPTTCGPLVATAPAKNHRIPTALPAPPTTAPQKTGSPPVNLRPPAPVGDGSSRGGT